MDYAQSTKLHPDDDRTQITTYNAIGSEALQKQNTKMLCHVVYVPWFIILFM